MQGAIQVPLADLKDGDLIFRTGRDLMARVVLAQGDEARYSHVGIVTMQGRDVYINGKYVATAKTHATTGQPLELGLTGVIPPGHYYVHGTNKDSLDSRYAITGWIKAETVVGKAQPIL